MANLYTKQTLASLVKEHGLTNIKLSGAGRTKEAIYNDLVVAGVINNEKQPLSTTKKKSEKETIYFYSHNEQPYGAFSNFYPSIFSDKSGKTFFSSEQYFMWRKALLFEDEEIANKILLGVTEEDFNHLSSDSRKWTNKMSSIKKLGRSVKNFDEEAWEEEREKAMIDGLRLKFSQNKDLKDLLLNTETKKLAEASPKDSIWGIGISKGKAEAGEKWQGRNLLGIALEKVRSELSKKRPPKKTISEPINKKKKTEPESIINQVKEHKIDPSTFFPSRGKNRTYGK